MKYDITMRQALRCEQAKEKRCTCRCLGKLHGARRCATKQAIRDLPETDPHYTMGMTKGELKVFLRNARKQVRVSLLGGHIYAIKDALNILSDAEHRAMAEWGIDYPPRPKPVRKYLQFAS